MDCPSQEREVLPMSIAASAPPRIAVAGLWHLGCVTAACCGRHFQVAGVGFDAADIANLHPSAAPGSEPGLNELLSAGLSATRLHFTTDPREACAEAQVLWLTYDTPVNDDDESNAAFVLERLRRCLPHLPPDALVLVSSQLPVGTCRA